MELNHLIVHAIVKDTNTAKKGQIKPLFNFHLRNDTINTSQKVIERFCKKLITKYKKSTPTYGKFEDDDSIYPMQNWVNEFIQKDFSEDSFIEMSQNTTKEMVKNIGRKGSTNEGYLFFLHYNAIFKSVPQNHLIVAYLENTVQFSINDENLIITQLESLDLSHLARAARVDLIKINDPNSKDYLTFIKGRGKLTEFFTVTIGCTDSVSSQDNIDKFHLILEEFYNDYVTNNPEKSEEELTKDYQAITSDAVVKTIDEAYEDNKIFTLNDFISNLPKHLREPFGNYIDSNDTNDVPNNFVISRKARKNAIEFDIKTDGLSISVNKKRIKDYLYYDSDTGKIELINLPESKKDSLILLLSENK